MTPTLISIYALGFLILIGGLVLIVVLARVLSASDDISDRIQAYSVIIDREISDETDKRRVRFLRLRLRLNNTFSVLVPKELRLQLISAHWPIYETEFVLIRISLTALGFFLGVIISQVIYPGIGLAIIAYITPGIFLRRTISKRRQKFGRQLIDVLVLVNGGVTAEYSLLQSLDIVIQELEPPSSEEFFRVKREVELGLNMNQALTNLSKRMENDDLNIVVAAININMQVGGNLTVMLTSVIQTIRERIRLFSEVRAITSAQRFTGFVLTLLPFIMGGVLFILNPSYMAKLFQPGLILIIPSAALVGILMGNIIINRMVKIDV